MMRAPIDPPSVLWHGPLDLSTAVRTTASRLASVLPARVRLECRLAADLPPLEADRREIEALVTQLAGEAAADLGPRGGWIRIETLEVSLGDAFLARSAGGVGLAPGTFVCLRIGAGPTRTAAAGHGALELAGGRCAHASLRDIVISHGGALGLERGRDGASRTTVAFPPAYRLRAQRSLAQSRADAEAVVASQP